MTAQVARPIVRIDEAKCTGCGDCIPSCAEGAIRIIDGKARLIAENLCDGMGACLGHCPEGAIIVESRQADAFDESAVQVHLKLLDNGRAAHGRVHKPANGARAMTNAEPHAQQPAAGACPGARMMNFAEPDADAGAAEGTRPSQLRQWPIQLHLASPGAPYFQGADVLLAADCVAFAVGDFHKDHLAGNSLAIACPKLDQQQEIYRQKITALVNEAKINTLTVMIMEVPCCGGLLRLSQEAVAQADRKVPIKCKVVGVQGNIVHEQWV